MKIDGQLKADELRVGRITIDYLKERVEVSALAGLISSRTGQAISWTKAEGNWSEETREAINALRELMERDIHKTLFGDGATSGLQPGSPGARKGDGVKIGGLGEHLEGGDAPSI